MKVCGRVKYDFDTSICYHTLDTFMYQVRVNFGTSLRITSIRNQV
jgi:hypothetical protein